MPRLHYISENELFLYRQLPQFVDDKEVYDPGKFLRAITLYELGSTSIKELLLEKINSGMIELEFISRVTDPISNIEEQLDKDKGLFMSVSNHVDDTSKFLQSMDYSSAKSAISLLRTYLKFHKFSDIKVIGQLLQVLDKYPTIFSNSFNLKVKRGANYDALGKFYADYLNAFRADDLLMDSRREAPVASAENQLAYFSKIIQVQISMRGQSSKKINIHSQYPLFRRGIKHINDYTRYSEYRFLECVLWLELNKYLKILDIQPGSGKDSTTIFTVDATELINFFNKSTEQVNDKSTPKLTQAKLGKVIRKEVKSITAKLVERQKGFKSHMFNVNLERWLDNPENSKVIHEYADKLHEDNVIDLEEEPGDNGGAQKSLVFKVLNWSYFKIELTANLSGSKEAALESCSIILEDSRIRFYDEKGQELNGKGNHLSKHRRNKSKEVTYHYQLVEFLEGKSGLLKKEKFRKILNSARLRSALLELRKASGLELGDFQKRFLDNSNSEKLAINCKILDQSE